MEICASLWRRLEPALRIFGELSRQRVRKCRDVGVWCMAGILKGQQVWKRSGLKTHCMSLMFREHV